MSDLIDRITRNYPVILRRCAEQLHLRKGTMTIYDVVHETVLVLVKDNLASQIPTDGDFVDYFMYRANVVVFREIHNQKSIHKAYAHYQSEDEADE